MGALGRLFGPPNVAKLKEKRDVDGLAVLLQHKDFTTRCEAARALGEVGGPRATNALAAALAVRHPAPGAEVAEALGNTGDPAAVQPLIEAIRGSSIQDTKRAAEAALVKLGPVALEPLLLEMEAGSGGVSYSDICCAGAAVARNLMDPRAVGPLTTALRNESSDRATGEVAGTLGELGDPLAFEPLVEVIEDGAAGGAAAGPVAMALVKTGGARAVEPLISLLKTPGGGPDWLGEHSSAREEMVAAADALAALGGAAVDELVSVLQDTTIAPLDNGPNVAVRRERTAETLGRIGDPRAVQPLVAVLVSEQEGVGVRRAAAEALGELGDARAVEPLTTIVQTTVVNTQGRSTLADAAKRALAQLGGEAAERQLARVDELVDALTQGDPVSRRTAAHSLGERPDVRAVAPLAQALDRDSDAEVRLAAAHALGLVVCELPAAASLRRDALVTLTKAFRTEDDPRIRVAVMDALARLEDKRAVESVAAALGDRDCSVREAAVKVLERLAPRRAVEYLKVALKDEDANVRRAGEAAIEHIGGPDAERALSEYRASQG